MGVEEILESLAQAGFTVKKTAAGSLEVSLPGDYRIAGSGGLLEARVEGDSIVIVNKRESGVRTVGISNPAESAALLYYMWLEAYRDETAKIVSKSVQAARRAGPTRECRQFIEAKTGVSGDKRICDHVLAGIVYGLGVFMVLTGNRYTHKDIVEGLIVPSASLGEALSASATALLSLYRALSPKLEEPERIVEAAVELADKYGLGLAYSKAGMSLAFYIDRIPIPWPSLLPGLLELDSVVRHVYPCRSVSLFEAGIQGEALWARTGDGTISCKPRSPVSTALATLYPSRLGPSLVMPCVEARGEKCLSVGEPECSLESIVVFPSDRGVESLLLRYGSGDSLTLYYYREKLVIGHARRGEGPRLEILGIGEDLSASPLRAWLLARRIKPVEARFTGKTVRPRDLQSFQRLRRIVRVLG